MSKLDFRFFRLCHFILWLLAIKATAYANPEASLLPWKLAIVPFETIGLTASESLSVMLDIQKSLLSTQRFEVMSQPQMDSLLLDAQFKLEGCNYAQCLSELGKVLGVERVAYGSVSRRGMLYTFQLRIVNVENGEIVFHQTLEHSGEFQAFLSKTIPQMARELTGTNLSANTSYQWVLIAAAVITFGIAIYFLNKTLGHSAGDSDGGNPPNPE